MITEDVLRLLVEAEIEKAKALYPQEQWHHPYRLTKLNDRKGSYGLASTKGVIEFSRAYLQTDEYDHLLDTIKHEIAHLIAGIRNGHNNYWRQIAQQLGCNGQRTQVATGGLVKNMARKWRLWGHMEDGTKQPFQSSHNRQSKYLKYDGSNLSAARSYKHHGNRIIKFTYELNKKED